MSSNQLTYSPDTILSPVTPAGRAGCFAQPVAAARQQTVVSSASGSLGPLPTTTTPLASPLNIVSATVDTSCVGAASNLLVFSCVVSLPAGATVTLDFQIRRTGGCGCQSSVVGSTYVFTETAAAAVSESFGFQLFDLNVQPGCYTYSVELSANSSVNTTGVSISNGVLSVLTVPYRC